MRYPVLGLSLFLLAGVGMNVRAQNAAARQAFAAGTNAARDGYYAQAQQLYQTALADMTAHTPGAAEQYRARLHYNLGVCAYHLQQFAAAVREYEQAVALMRGRHPQALYALGMTHAARRDWTAARAAFERSLELTKCRDGETWFDLAMVLIEQRDFDAARAAFVNALKYKTRSAPAAHNNLGVLHALGGDWQAADKEFAVATQTADTSLPEAARNRDISRRALAAREFDPARTLARLTFSSNNNPTFSSNHNPTGENNQ